MTAQINIRCQPSPVLSGVSDRKTDLRNLDILDETGAAITEETGAKIDT